MTKPFSCPACKRPIPNRKAKLCGYCSAPVPEHLLLDEESQIKLREQQKVERKRHEEFKEDNPEPVRASLGDVSSI